jgi:hypothetical protein
MSIKLFPNYKFNDLEILVTEYPNLMNDILYKISGLQLAEDLTAWMTPKPEWADGFLQIYTILCFFVISYGLILTNTDLHLGLSNGWKRQ